MKDERNNMDELFREGLDDFNPTPPPDLWERIDAALPPAPPAPVTQRISRRVVQLGLAALIITGISVLWYFFDNNSSTVEQPEVISHQEPAMNTATPSNGKQPALNSDQTEIIPESLPITGPVNEGITEYPDQELKPVKQTEAQTPLKETFSDLKSTNDFLATNKNQLDVGEENQTMIQPGAFDLRLDLINWLRVLPVGTIDQRNYQAFDLRFKNTRKPILPKRSFIPLIGGAYASWDMIYYGNGHQKQSRAAGLSLSTFKGPWEFETGLAFNISDDNGKFDVSFSSLDSIGYYNKVVSFSTDPQIPGRVIFNTVVEGVYDSVGHNIETQTANRYAYLQIPLMAGYRIYADRLFTISLKAGPVFSLMIGSDEQQATFSQEGAKLQSINNLSPSRVSANWQVAAALGVGVRLSPRVTLLAEPTYKSYLRPVYRNNQIKPQSIGIKAGLLYRF